ncbi:hypothetical protein F3K32_42405 [Streptomyces sp. LBUM 1483]|uniref:hypothetical protein n=1 Tax=Streptomyces scabiei TaxID=1930 RepID=UPI001B334541|nr:MULTISPECIES: hypothetical protein [Streptomyces]MBP5926663.1 hypothetical protein [Streptomyces sp. LBUM 1483]MDX3122756.1 hypothetical protein [Streptomyces scabiei]MDX3199355.1 hypothetical protein [Streptomyces scabiei]MDX3223205.1 hypothetical protein [Streptomyces scabiei]
MTDPIPLRRPAREKGHTCICGATWRPGFSSDPAWLLTAHPDWRLLEGVLYCQACNRKKLDVFKEQAEARRAAVPPAIPPRERPAAPVISLFRKARRAMTDGERQ